MKSYAAVRVSVVPATPSRTSKATRPGLSMGNPGAWNHAPPAPLPALFPSSEPDDTRAAMSVNPTMRTAMYTAPIIL